MQLSSKARKAVATGLALSTFLWASIGLVPQFASAAVHSDGCLVLSGGIVWMITGGTRRGFTSAEVFQSSGYNFSQVVTATAEDIALPVGPIMVYADGTLVKGPSDPLVYLVAGGQKRPFVSGSVFLGLGFSFANIQSAPSNTFADLPVGANLDSTTIAHPAGVQVISNGAVWWMDANGRRGFTSAAQFNSYGYMFSHVVAANAADLALANIGDVPVRAGCTGGGTTPVTTSGAFSVSLASDTPVAASVVTDATNGGQALASLVKFNFVGGSSGATVTTVVLHRTGISSDSSINNAYLYDGATRLAQMQSISNGVMTFTLSTGLFTVSANTVRAITVKADIAKSATAGQTIGFSLNAATDVTATGSVNPTGSFPLAGNNMTVAVVTDLGKITVANVTPSGTGTADPQNAYTMWTFSLAASNQNLKVSYLAFTNLGSTSAGDIQNIKLMEGGVQIGSTVAQQDANRMVAFDLSAAPLAITSGVTKQLKLVGDLISGSTRTFQWSLQNSSDVQSVDTQYNVSLFPFPSGGTVGTWSVVKAGGATTINAGSLSVSKASDSPSGTVALNGTNVTLAKYKFVASGEPVKVSTLSLFATVTGSATIKNVKLYANGVQVSTTKTTITGDGSTKYEYTLGNSLVVTPGTDTIVTVVADLTGTAVDTNTVLITLYGTTNSYGQGTLSLSTLDVPAANKAANSLVISASALSAAKNPALAAVTVVNGATNQRIGSWLITAGASEGVNLNSITIVDGDASQGSGGGTSGLGAGFSNVKLMSGSTQLGTTVVNPSATADATQSFSLNPVVAIAAGQSIQVDVYADVLSTDTWTDGDSVDITIASTGVGASTASSVTVAARKSAQAVTISAKGTVTLALDGSSPANAQQLVMGSTANTLGVWQFSANALENLNVNQIIVTEAGATGGDFLNFKLMVNGAQVGNTVPALTVASGGTATFGSAGTTLFSVTANSFVKVTLVADMADSTNSTGATSATFAMGTPASITGIAADKIIVTGQQSGAYATLASASATYTSQGSLAYRTKPVITNVAVAGSTTNTRTANDIVFAMNIAANSAYQVAFRSSIFQSADSTTTAFSGAISTAATWTVVDDGTDGSAIAADTTSPIEGTGHIRMTQGATTPAAGSGMKDTFAATDLSGYNGVAFWVRASRSSISLTLTLTGASAGSHTATTPGSNNDQWQLVVVPFSGATTPFTGLTAVTAFNIKSASAYTSADTLDIGAFYFYKDFIKVNVSGSKLTDATLVTLKDATSGATFATGYFDGTNATATANTSGTVYFFPTTEYDVSAGANRNLNLITDSTALLNAATSSIVANVSLGTSASTLASPGDVVWYDGKVSTAVPWVDTQPNPVQGATRNY